MDHHRSEFKNRTSMLSTHIGEREAEYMIELFYLILSFYTGFYPRTRHILHTEWETIQRDHRLQRIFPLELELAENFNSTALIAFYYTRFTYGK